MCREEGRCCAGPPLEIFAQAERDGLLKPFDVRWEFIRSFDYSPYLPSEMGSATAEEVELLIRETQRFFGLLARGCYFHMASSMVDELWHNMIMHTMTYAEFCANGIGVFGHHTPGTFMVEIPPDEEFTLPYVHHYGEFPNRLIWNKLNCYKEELVAVV